MNETHLPTEQEEKGKNFRIPEENEDQRRKENRQPPSQKRPQTPHRLKFPKKARLLSRSDYQKVIRSGHKMVGQKVVIDYRLAPHSRLGVTISKRFGKAHERNFFKRRVKEAFRHLKPSFSQDLELNILPKNSFNVSKSEIEKDILQLLNHVKTPQS